MHIPFRRTTLYTTSKTSATRVEPLDEAKTMRRAKINERRRLPERRHQQSPLNFEDRRKRWDRRATTRRPLTHKQEGGLEKNKGQLVDTNI